MMNRYLMAFIVSLILSACGSGQTVEQKRAMLESMRREAYADLFRHEAECRAVAFEFPDDQKILESCIDTHRFMIENAERTSALIDKRLAELERMGR